MKKNVYVRLKKGQEAAVAVGDHILYPPTDFSYQDFICVDSNDEKVKSSLAYHKGKIDVKNKKPINDEGKKPKKKQNKK